MFLGIFCYNNRSEPCLTILRENSPEVKGTIIEIHSQTLYTHRERETLEHTFLYEMSPLNSSCQSLGILSKGGGRRSVGAREDGSPRRTRSSKSVTKTYEFTGTEAVLRGLK